MSAMFTIPCKPSTKVLIVRLSTKWTHSKQLFEKEFSYTTDRKLSEEELKRVVRQFEEHLHLFPMEDIVSAAVEKQKVFLESQKAITRICYSNSIAEEVVNFRPHWIITIGDSLLYVKSCRLIFDETKIVGVNLENNGMNGYLCYGGTNIAIPVDVRSIQTFQTARPRIAVTITYAAAEQSETCVKSRLILNEVYIGNDNERILSKMEFELDSETPQNVTFQDILILTGTGCKFKHENYKKNVKSLIPLSDFYTELDEKTTERLANFNYEGFSMNENDPKFVVFTKYPSLKMDCLKTEKLSKLSLTSKINGIFIVLDGIEKIELKKGTVIKLELKSIESLNDSLFV